MTHTKLHLLLVFLTALPAFANETITVTVTGLGKTVETARKSAIQKAVRKALGEIVDAETMAKNGELINDEVITYSDGFVSKTLDVAGPTLDEDLNLYTLTLQAEVVRSKVVKRLKEVNVRVVEVDGNSLFAQALSKKDKAESGKKLLAKVLNEDLNPAKLITCQLVGLDAGGMLIRGKEALANSVEILEGGEVELTTLWEISVDMDAYYKRALPRLSAVINQVSKRKVSSNTKRHLAYSFYGRPNDKTFFSFPTKQPLLFCNGYHHNWSVLHLAYGDVYLGMDPDDVRQNRSVVDMDKVPRDSPWRISSVKEEFFVAFELRSSPSRTEADYEIHIFDRKTFLNTFLSSHSRILPSFQVSAFDRDDGIVFQKEIQKPRFVVANNKNQKLLRKKSMLHGYGPSGNNAALKDTPVGLNKIYEVRDGISFTISPEIPIEAEDEDARDGNWDDGGSSIAASSVVLEVKQKLSLDDLKQIKDLVMQPISRNPNE